MNAHIFPGPSIIIALKEAAAATVTSLNQCVSTEISAGTPRTSSDGDDYSHSDADADDDMDDSEARAAKYSCTGRKRSIVTATTISQYTERTVQQTPLIIPRSVPDDYYADEEDDDNASSEEDGGSGARRGKQRQLSIELAEAPIARGLLLLAEMSSEGNLLTGTYTRRCVELARQHRDFVLGFVSQQCLNSEPGDNFVSFTPGVSLPPRSDDGAESAGKGVGAMGDGLGQQYRTPRKVVLEEGCDVVIVGRGILKARDRKREAERYRVEAWRAYEERVSGGRRK